MSKVKSKAEINQPIDYRRLALKKMCLSGHIEQRELQDLKTVVSQQQGDVKYQLSFEYIDGFCMITGWLKTILNVTCLRCLQQMDWPLKSAIDLAIVEDEAKLAAVPLDYEAWVLADKALTLRSLLTEELLLSVPLDIRHKERNCQDAEGVINTVKKTDVYGNAFEKAMRGQMKKLLV